MEKISYYDSLKLNNTVVILGKFDGFHLGHQHLLKTALRLKKEYADEHPDREPLQVVIFTFDVFPGRVLADAEISEGTEKHATRKIRTIQTEEERFMDPVPVEADYLIEFPFNRETMSMEPERFVEEVLVSKLGVKKIICGYDFRFGKKRRGDVGMLQELGKEKGFEVFVVPKLMKREEEIEKDGGNEAEREISSTWIRNEISEGHMEQAAAMMGRPYVVTGIVRQGQQQGRTIGFPTVNLEVPETKILPPDGVYAAKVIIKKDPEKPFRGGISDNGSDYEIYQAMTIVRRNPASGSDETGTTETFMFGFNGDLYDSQIAVWFFHFVRPEIEFDNEDERTKQLYKDEAVVKDYFSHLVNKELRETIH